MILLVCYLLVWAFILSWISNMILHEDLPIRSSFLIIILTGVILIVYAVATAKINPALSLFSVPLGAAVLGFSLQSVTKGDLKKCLVIGAVFAGLWWVVQLMLAAGLQSTAA